MGLLDLEYLLSFRLLAEDCRLITPSLSVKVESSALVEPPAALEAPSFSSSLKVDCPLNLPPFLLGNCKYSNCSDHNASPQQHAVCITHQDVLMKLGCTFCVTQNMHQSSHSSTTSIKALLSNMCFHSSFC